MTGVDATDITAVARGFGLELTGEAAARIKSYFELLLRWNARINLTGASSLADLVAGYLPDSFAMASLIGSDARVVDVGSGGGLPAVPFALCRPDCATTLVEPRAKRVAFLRTAVRELGLGTTAVFDGRMEDVQERFSAASSMATFAPVEWVTRASKLLAGPGRIVAFLREDETLPSSFLRSQTLKYGSATRPRSAVAIDVPGRW